MVMFSPGDWGWIQGLHLYCIQVHKIKLNANFIIMVYLRANSSRHPYNANVDRLILIGKPPLSIIIIYLIINFMSHLS